MKPKRKIIIAITGASGSIYGKLILKKLSIYLNSIKEVAVLFSREGEEVWKYEIGALPKFKQPFKKYDFNDFFAPLASGSAGYDIMIVCPCTMGTLGRIANGTSDNLIIRAADVILKEKKKLILVTRESPYNLIHISNMKKVVEAGAIICPANPSFYSKPASIEELTGTVVNKVLTLADFETDSFHWGE
jgi:flavin prenyltransferase